MHRLLQDPENPRTEQTGKYLDPHCKIGAGCTIYDSRPESCRVYECIWLQTQAGEKPMPLELRPDRSHVVIGTTNQGEDLVLYVSPDHPDAWKRGAFVRFVATMKARGVAMVLNCGAVTKAL